MKRFLLLGLLTALNAPAWDGTGHMLVAQIARDRMSTQAIARVDALAAKLDNHGTPYNGVSIACWPDDIKDKDSNSPFQGKFKKWHYIDIGCATTDPDALNERPVLSESKGDVVTAINHCVELIRTHKTDELVPKEEVALALLVHFVGDIHQPLHTASLIWWTRRGGKTCTRSGTSPTGAITRRAKSKPCRNSTKPPLSAAPR
jgi:hypothetical protein